MIGHKIATLAAAVLAASLLAGPVAAEPIRLERGFSTDLWTSWPDDAAMLAPGALDVFPEWRRSVPDSALSALRAAGFDFVRLTIDPAAFLVAPDPARTAHLLDQIDAAVAQLLAHGLKVVVDLHATPREGSAWGAATALADASGFAAYRDLVGRVAARVGALDPERVALELMNEPLIDCPWIRDEAKAGPWPELLQLLHATARRAAPATTLVLTGACWGGIDGLVALEPLPVDDPNTLWSLHFYEPMLATHQGAAWASPVIRAFRGMPWPSDRVDDWAAARLAAAALGTIAAEAGDAAAREERTTEALHLFQLWRVRVADPADVRRELARAVAWAERHGIAADRLLLGEFGMIRPDRGGTDPESRTAYLAAVRAAAEAAGIAWAVWGLGGDFAITLEPDARPDPAVMAPLGLRS